MSLGSDYKIMNLLFPDKPTISGWLKVQAMEEYEQIKRWVKGGTYNFQISFTKGMFE